MSCRFVRVELSYGCQQGHFELGPNGRPCVIAGANGSGKSTLVEGIVRTLYGFNRQRRDERERAERREPWENGEFMGRVVLERADGARIEVSRDLRTDRVVARQLDTRGGGGAGPDAGVILFDGTANPGSGRRDAERYRQLLDTWLGFGELEDYQRTMCIEQGELRSTALTESLLQLAAGGHAALDAAKDTLRTAFRDLTRDPLEEGDRRRPKDRELEKERENITALVARLELARKVERSRQPLKEEERELTARAESLFDAIECLEDALDPLATLQRLREQCATLEERVQRLERFRRQLDERLQDLQRAQARWAQASAGPLYPDDFNERLAVLRRLWEDERELEREVEALEGEARDRAGRPRIPEGSVATGAAAIASTLVVGGALRTVLPAVGVVLVALGCVLVWLRREEAKGLEIRKTAADARRARIAGLISDQLEGVPHADTLSVGSAADHGERFAEQQQARAALAGLRASIDALLGSIETDLPSQGELPLLPGLPPEELERAAAIAPILDHEVSRARTELAKRSLELERSEAVTINLPDGLEPSYGAVRAVLDRRRSEHREVSARAAALRRRLLEAETGDNPLTLAEQIDGARERDVALSSEVEALRDAFELLTDAYSEFRAGDQERLLHAVSTQLERVSAGSLGPVETDSVLEAAHVVVRGRRLPLDSPPLSFGELHAVLLAVRLGAADFLAGSGHRAPLIIDEPFTHLDEERAAQVWTQLQEVGRDRQTIITTQARLLLEHLGVTPDLRLAAPGRLEAPAP